MDEFFSLTAGELFARYWWIAVLLGLLLGGYLTLVTALMRIKHGEWPTWLIPAKYRDRVKY